MVLRIQPSSLRVTLQVPCDKGVQLHILRQPQSTPP